MPHLLLSVFLFTNLMLSAQDAATDDQRLVDALNHFAGDLHGQLANGDMPVSSPASVAFALLMLLPGARGETADELAATLRLPEGLRGQRLEDAIERLLKTYDIDGLEMRLRNDLWIQTGHEVVPAYARTLRQKFAASLRQLNFAGDLDDARQQINSYIDKVTNHRIPQLLTSLPQNTRHVLTNAIWYRGRWRFDFYRPKMREAFFVTADQSVKVPMMHAEDHFHYRESDAWQYVALPFRDGSIEFELILPRPGHDLADAEAALIRGLHQGKRTTSRLRLSMPTFRMRIRGNLRAPLQSLGLAAMFQTNRADFSGIDAKTPLNIDDIVHGTWINVDENGVEAAAATALLMEAGAAIQPDEPKTMRADRPFAFSLRDRRSGLLLFVGRVTNPSLDS